MGINLKSLVKTRHLSFDELNGKIVAMDAHNILYQFISSIRTPEGHPLSTNDGKVISHLKGLLNRTTSLMKGGIKPVFIYDGEPHTLKKGTLDLRRERKERARIEWEKALEDGDLRKARTKAQQTSRLSDEMIEDSIRLLEIMGIPIIKAPGEGEAQASYMCSRGDVFCACSQDFDSLLFGCPVLVRNLTITGKRKLPGKNKWIDVQPEIITLDETLDELDITREQLVDMAILMGTDFNEGVSGIGPKRSLKMIRKYVDLERLVKAERLPLLEWEEVRSIFLKPNITDDYELKWKPVDKQGVMEMLVEELGFGRKGVEKAISKIGGSENRSSVPQTSLDSFL